MPKDQPKGEAVPPPESPDAHAMLDQEAVLDQELVEWLNQWFQRRAPGLAEALPFDEAAWVERLGVWNRGPLATRELVQIVRELAAAGSRIERATRVAFLGPLYSYSHLAAIHRFGHSGDLIPVQSISTVFEEVRQGNADYGIVPLANSTDGRIVDTLDSFARMPVPISGEVPLRIHHHLLGRCPRSEVDIVCSKPQALSQCRQWLARHVPHAVLVETASTTAAAERAASEAGVAAVASREAATHYGLELLAENIEDAGDNVTRFAVIGGEPPPPGPLAKTALMFELIHEIGALAGAMDVFRKHERNLTWLESFPKRGAPNEYFFFVELEGHASEPSVVATLADLQQVTVACQVLGCYLSSEPIE